MGERKQADAKRRLESKHNKGESSRKDSDSRSPVFLSVFASVPKFSWSMVKRQGVEPSVEKSARGETCHESCESCQLESNHRARARSDWRPQDLMEVGVESVAPHRRRPLVRMPRHQQVERVLLAPPSGRYAVASEAAIFGSSQLEV